MPLPQRNVGLNPIHNRENPTRAVKGVSAPIRQLGRRPILDNIEPPTNNQHAQRSMLLRKPSSNVIPSEIPKNKTTVVPKPIIKPTTGINSVPSIKPNENPGYSTSQIINIVDIDAEDTKNPFLVTEYVQDIFKYLHELEHKYKIQDKYLTCHQTAPRMRSVLVNWIVNVCINFKFLQETLHLTIAILDRYLQLNKNIGRDVLQLVGITSMLIAAKYEEIYVPAISDFVYICDDAFTAKQIFQTEMDILAGLKFNLGRPLSLHFLRRYSKIACNSVDQHNMAKYFLEIFLLDYDLCSVDPSLQAATACCLSVSILNDLVNPADAWNETLEYYSMYKYAEIKPVIVKLIQAYRKIEKSKFQSIKKKYSGKNLSYISNHEKLQTSKLLKGANEN